MSEGIKNAYQQIIKDSSICWWKKENEMSELFNKIKKDVADAHGIKLEMKTIEIDIESVLSRVGQNNEIVEGIFPTTNGEDILIKFVKRKDE